jgi:hypothetical protein
MSLTLILAINALADLALAAGLAYTMSRAARLTPHASSRAVAPEAQLAGAHGDARRSRSSRPRADARTRGAIAGRGGGQPALAHE